MGLISLKKYDIPDARFEEIIATIGADQVFRHVKTNDGPKLNQWTFDEFKLTDSIRTNRMDGLPSIHMWFHQNLHPSTRSAFDVKVILDRMSGFTPEQEVLLRALIKEMKKQDEVFEEILAKESAAREEELERARLQREIQAKEDKYQREKISRVEMFDESGARVSKEAWEALYEAAASESARSYGESRAVVYNGVLFCNAKRALEAFDERGKDGDKLYQACERHKKYNGSRCAYATADQLREYIDLHFGEAAVDL